jgi:hypothetical protein
LLNFANRFIKDIDGTVHFVSGDDQGRPQGQDIALDGFSGKTFFKAL